MEYNRPMQNLLQDFEQLLQKAKDERCLSKAVGWKGGGSFVYAELMQWGERWLKRIDAVNIEQQDKAQANKELEKIRQELFDSPWISYRVDLRKFAASKKEFAALALDDQRRVLKDAVDKNSLYVNLSEMKDRGYGVSKEDQGVNQSFYNL